MKNGWIFKGFDHDKGDTMCFWFETFFWGIHGDLLDLYTAYTAWGFNLEDELGHLDLAYVFPAYPPVIKHGNGISRYLYL